MHEFTQSKLIESEHKSMHCPSCELHTWKLSTVRFEYSLFFHRANAHSVNFLDLRYFWCFLWLNFNLWVFLYKPRQPVHAAWTRCTRRNLDLLHVKLQANPLFPFQFPDMSRNLCFKPTWAGENSSSKFLVEPRVAIVVIGKLAQAFKWC